ncbi:MAG: hypothetical protein A3J65_02075 [Candidatus Buchananbacteria bacterium RIFCSPHIGHO2_02_FULL_45_11b]|uniref:Uncharacterized protein n=3 Tax=Candidatus Buchananiibacteriota TaxID=1817903 RepID=A0A1G1YKE7_9BACT|nr:MAG: hypothetical protein A2663_02775 [Candidatus Buchananbacteria bacterium RIFCSPHIGHO2_01_FULL_46_12]OGY52744.1 MAG: hypothetical protein A3J65_02075 [Candidatus Buchananbacteria bacterium RIFCSPHIGHO2_02_FULL_45_11b]OGY57818.1 MAG: hypothetical protein A3H67_03330 [Candidatus Buchananbacteria bacterium RIFCSPLOWO2_02_FULL_46_11b]
MKIAQGKHRFVVAFPRLGIAIKIAKIKPIEALKRFWNVFIRHKGNAKEKLTRLKFELFKMVPRAMPTIGYHLFYGIYNNWREFIFYQKTKNLFLQPTWFSFIGLFNIQPYGRPTDRSLGDLRHGLYDLTDGQVSLDGHHFDEPSNFTVENNRLKILDYGHQTTQKIITAYGQKIWEEFDPSQCPKYK